ncbi:hypothetical protein ACIA8K_10145 [Catenuloplanes sp. NPDC051500]|uniref:hypothetical protein n=1 Tax=Catenuloplanes sp. NPDC051500 TaxID=3363959 RepID=UPI00378B1D77
MRSSTDSIVIPLDVETARRAVHAALTGLPRVTSVYVGVSVVEARTRMNLWSWGEAIHCRLWPENGGTRVDVESRSIVPMTIVDYGTNRDNVRLLMTVLGGALIR